MSQILVLQKTFFGEIETNCQRLLKSEWIINGNLYCPSDKGWKFAFNNKKRALGTCNRINKTISLSKELILVNQDAGLWDDVMRHELAHAIDYMIRGKSDHSPIWQDIARQVGCSKDAIASKIRVNPSLGKYTLICNSCKKTQQSHKVTKRLVACGSCCNTHNFGMFSLDYLLERHVNN